MTGYNVLYRKALGVIASGLMLGSMAAQAADVEIKLELPQPVYGGTPLDYWGENLEPQSFKPIDPIMAAEGSTNVAKGKPVTSSTESPSEGKLAYVTDGDKEASETSFVELKTGHQWVQIDLGEVCDLYAIVVWHYHAAERVYFDVAVKVADDAEMTQNVQTVYNNDHNNSAGIGVGSDKEYIESYKGRVIRLSDIKGRYVRLFSNGNTSDDANHYIEVEVYGKPAK